MSENELIALMAAPIYAALRSRNFEEENLEMLLVLAVRQAKALLAVAKKLS